VHPLARQSAGLHLSAALVTICFWSAIALAQAAAPTATALRNPVNIGEYEIELRHYEESGQYERDLAAVTGEAKRYLAQQTNRSGKLAMVLDIDETSLSNWPAISADDFTRILDGPCYDLPHGPCGLKAWLTMARDRAIAPTLELYRQARGQGVAVFFITGRHEGLRDATVRNLHDAGYDTWSDLVMEPDCLAPASAAYFKAPARGKIVAEGYTIVVNVGDQASDLLGGYAERTFKLPNPFYVIP
jgi:predicted secreted acid phosphatase